MYTPYSHRQRLTEVPRGVKGYDTQSGVHGLYWRQPGGLCEYDTRVWGREARLLEGERGFTATQTHTGILHRQVTDLSINNDYYSIDNDYHSINND